MRRKQSARYRDISRDQFAEKIRIYGRSLMSLGLKLGQPVAIMATGGCTVPVYHTETLKTIHDIIDADAIPS